MKIRLLWALLAIAVTSASGLESTPTAQGAAAGTVQVQPITKGQRVFSCGHSFHFFVPEMLNEIAQSAGYAGHAVAGTSMIGGSKSIQHWNVKDEVNKAKQALSAGQVDVLTLTPIYLPDEGIEKFAQLGLAHNPEIRVTVQEFWLPYDEFQPHYYDAPRIPPPKSVDHNAATVFGLRETHASYFREMDALISSLNKDLGKQVLYVVPVGQAVIALREKIIAGKAPGLKVQEDLFTDPLGHARPALQVLVAYCHYAVIYRKNPAGLPLPKILKQAKEQDDEASALNRLLQELAWDAVIQHPLSGVTSGGK